MAPDVNGNVYYNATPTGPETFNADSVTNYPYEIYLPNEIKPADYRIHTNYTKNTDACASCHATHTAVGPSLLQWDSVYDTCMACHDGTVATTYNVVTGQITPCGPPTYGGCFPLNAEGSDHSIHGVNTVDISSAPGGSVISEPINRDNGETDEMWKAKFGCESCHSPHGQGGNARILHPDPNGWATKQAEKLNHLYSVDINSVSNVAYVVNDSKKITLIKGSPYKIVVQNISAGTVSDITYKFEISNYGDYVNGSYTTIIPRFNANDLTEITNVYGTAALTVRMSIYNYLEQGEQVLHLSGINNFCGACHPDYNTEDEVLAGNGADVIMGSENTRPGYGNINGDYAKAYRHAVGVAWNFGDQADSNYVGSDKIMKTEGLTEDTQRISCLTCHFAHGTDWMMWGSWISKYNTFGIFDDWLNPTIETDVDGNEIYTYPLLQELSGQSALKRLPNMATCEACHQKASANEGYNINSGQ